MTKGMQWLEMRRCGTCGKDFAVLYPHLWRFKRGEGAQKKFFCSWGCVREFDQKGVEKVEMSEKNRKAVEIALDGGNPIEYLKKEGSKNPSAAWYSIKAQVKEKDPETYAKLPGTRRKKAETDQLKPERNAEEIRTELVINKEGMVIRPEGQPKDIFEKFEIRSVESGLIYKRAEGGMTMILDGKGIFLDKRTWKQLAEEIPKALKTLGVET